MRKKKTEPPLVLQTGRLTIEQINLMMRHLPLEVTFVDESGAVAYYSAQPQGMFPRQEDVLGSSVVACHSPQNQAAIRVLLDDFRSGKQDMAEQWVTRDGRTYYIWYLPMRDEQGEYRGTLEAALDVTHFLQSGD